MAETPDPHDLELLGLGKDATMADLHRAYQRARSMWAEDSLATYGLVDEAERDAILARLTLAYERLSRSVGSGSTGTPAPQSGAAARANTSPDARGEAPSREPWQLDGPEATDPGAVLRMHREERGIGLDEVARTTRIRQAILQALEKGDRGPLPAPVYVRGFVIAYAEVVGIEDPEELAHRYLRWLETRQP